MNLPLDVEPLSTIKYFSKPEIEAHLKNVEYIIMAAPMNAPEAKYPIHFTIFLNTQEKIPDEYLQPVIEKFKAQYNITHATNFLTDIQAVAFGQTSQDTPMPMHVFDTAEQKEIPHTKMFIIDFEGDSPSFQEPKDGKTGWSYSYN